MKVQLTVNQEAQLILIAEQAGKTPDELVREVVLRYIADEVRLRAAVQSGFDDAARGNFVPTSEVWAAVERALKA
jgi:predicted transcriptional regulator